MTIETGDLAPDFTLTSHSGEPVSLGDFAGKGVIIYFYPKAFTPGCTTESCDFRDRYETFQGAGYEILGISPDPADRLAGFRDRHSLPFPLLSDPDHAVAAKYGAWGIKKNYGKEYQGVIRSTFEVGPDGKIVNAWRNVRARGHAERILDATT